jgi:hypothetical protein
MKKKKYIILIIVILLLSAVGFAFWHHRVHQYDGMFWLNRRSGVLHNHTCKHFKNRQPEELSPWKDIESFQYRNCRMCKGDRIRQK